MPELGTRMHERATDRVAVGSARQYHMVMVHTTSPSAPVISSRRVISSRFSHAKSNYDSRRGGRV